MADSNASPYASSLDRVARFSSERFSVFVSYSSADTAVAMTLSQLLGDNGIRHWYAPEFLRAKGGRNYMKEIVDGVNNCAVVLLVYSRSSAASGWVENEISLALEKHKIIITLRLDDTPFTGVFEFLGARQLFTISFESPADPLRKVLESISDSLCRRGELVLPDEGRLRDMLGSMVEPVRPYGGLRERWHYDMRFRRRVRRRIRIGIGAVILLPFLVWFGIKVFTTYYTCEYRENGSYEGYVNLLGWKQGKGTERAGRFIYEGEWLFDCRHGKGALYLIEGTDTVQRFEGNYFMNAWYGEGTLRLKRATYAGGFYWGKKSGYGEEWVFANSAKTIPRSRYVGEWEGGVYHGKGAKRDFSKGRFYEGEWRLGQKDGYGIEIDSGAVRRGEWQDSAYRHINWLGYRYEGGWRSDRPFGKGSLSSFVLDGTERIPKQTYAATMKGRWLKDELFEGEIEYFGGASFRGKATTSGLIQRPRPCEGILRDTSGNVWNGIWRDWSFTGTVDYADGTVVSGKWDAYRIESGEFRCPDGTICRFGAPGVYGRREGTIAYADGSRYEGGLSVDLDSLSFQRNAAYENYEHVDKETGDTSMYRRMKNAVLTRRDGTRIEAVWQKDTIERCERVDMADGRVYTDIRNTSLWRDGRLVRKGPHARITYPDGRIYVGFVTSAGEPDEGRMKYPNGDWYDGKWSAAKPGGEGRYRRGRIYYEGEWNGDSGTGRIDYPDGTTYEGGWVGFKREGYGRLSCRGRVEKQGLWRNDDFLD